MAKVTLDSVTKIFADGTVAVRDLTLDVADGELVVLVGPSGCGKSTTLRLIAGLEPLTDGTIHIGDRRVDELPPRDRDVAMVFQNYALYPHMTVRQNLAFGLKLRKTPKREIAQRVGDAADVLGIADVLERRPAQLSGGQRQRVALGRAIVRQPLAFLFDEPLSNLDAKLRVQTRKEIARLHRQLGATMVYVTHDQVEAMTLGDRIVVMNEGRVQQIDRPLALYDRPANRFVAGFIGSPAMNFVAGRLESGSELFFRAGDGQVRIRVTASPGLTARAGGAVVLGIRPEHIVPGPEPDGPPALDSAGEATLESVEPMGHEVVVGVRWAGHDLVYRAPPGPLPPVGTPIELRFDTRRLHFFDPDTGQSIRTG